MDDNISHAIALMGATLLFMAAFSLSVIFYNGLQDRADEFFEVTSLAGRQEDATAIIVNRNDIERKIRFEEVFLAILNLPDYVSGAGNDAGSKIIIKDASGAIKGTYTASFDLENNIRKVTLASVYYGYMGNLVHMNSYLIGKYDRNNPKHRNLESLNDMIVDFSLLVLDGRPSFDTNDSSNTLLTRNKELIKNTTFSIQYSGDAIVYTRN